MFAAKDFSRIARHALNRYWRWKTSNADVASDTMRTLQLV
jgi:hypothetical protein